MLKILTFVVICFVALLVLLVFLIYNYSRIGIYHNQEEPFPQVYGFTEVSFTTKDNVTIYGWFKKHPLGSDKTVILSHGIGTSKMDMLDTSDIFYHEADANVFIYDFRGHGKCHKTAKTSFQCDKTYTTFGIKEVNDLKSAAAKIQELYPVETKKIILFGISMGASVSLMAAPDIEAVVGIIADSPYRSLQAALTNHAYHFYRLPKSLGFLMVLGYRLRFMNFDKIPSPIEKVGDIEKVKKILYIHGKSDGRIPYSDSWELKHRTKVDAELSLYDTAGHVQALSEEPERYIHEIVSFVKDI